ncbi:MAG: type II toxin-antitoxin system RelB/DinJ family antitoxin [Bacilli bacterium]|nr:type II toxin-antitoxin system RelB/DinJ family antitoxin [Bacilli bacterium]
MPKTETVHTRVTPEIKNRADKIFESMGLTTSQAIMLFLTASVNKNGLPFELSAPSKEDEDLAFATAIATVDGMPPSKEAVKILRLYSRGDIDLETAKFAIERLYKK